MSKDDQVVNLIRDGFKKLDAQLSDHHALLKSHMDEDKAAWARLEMIDREITIVKRVGLILGSCVTAVAGVFGLKQ